MGACVSKFHSTPHPSTDPSLVDQQPPPLGSDHSILPNMLDKPVISDSPPPTTSSLADTSKSDLISTSSSSAATSSSSSSSTSTSASSSSTVNSDVAVLIKPKYGGGPPGQGGRRRPPPVRARSSSPTIRSSSFQRSRSVDMQIRQLKSTAIPNRVIATAKKAYGTPSSFPSPPRRCSNRRRRSSGYGKESIAVQRIHDVGHSPAWSDGRKEKGRVQSPSRSLLEDLNNPLISMDCFIFL